MSDNFNLVQAQAFTLSGSGVTATATTIILQSFQTPDGTNIAMSNFGTTGYGTLEPGTSREEQITFTGVTQNADGTADLTGVTRGLSFTAPHAEDSDLKQAHSGGASFVLSNTAKMYDQFLKLNEDGTVNETLTFSDPNFPQMDSSSATPVNDEQLATKGYVDSVAAGSNININRLVVTGTAGETVQAGDWLYFDETDEEWKKADSSAASTSENVQLGVAQGAGTDGNGISGGVLIQGQDENQSGLTAGTLYYLSDTAGVITDSAGTKEVEVGYAVDTTKIVVNFRFKHYLTKDQKDALAGTSGTPSTSNKFVTDDDVAVTATADKIVRADGSNKIDDGYLQMTDTDATTLTNGSDADSLHTHDGIGIQFVDTVVYNSSAPTSYTDLDLSSVVGSNLALVVLKISISGTNNTVSVRPNGDSSDYHGDIGGATSTGSDTDTSCFLIVKTDSAGIIEFKASSSSSLQLRVVAYLK